MTNTKLVLAGRALLIGALAATPALLQAAQEPGAPAPAAAPSEAAQSGRHRHHDPAAYVQKRLERLKAKLQITQDQEPQWTAFSSTVVQQMEQLKTARSGMRGVSTTAPERIDRQVALMKQRTAAFEAVAQSAKELYSVLTPEQQRVADERLLRPHGKRMG
jgi:periplasmic protein CpxP/Spy